MISDNTTLQGQSDVDQAPLNRRRQWLSYLVIALVTVAVWGHTIQFQFTWDDRQFIVENESIHSWEHLPAMLSRRDGQSSLPEHFCLYRPVRTVAYAVLNQIGGGPPPHPWVYHAANLVGHAIAAILLCSVAGALLQRFGSISRSASQLTGFLLGLAFVVHPVTSEVVCWAKSFDDILAVIFCLGALAQLLAWQEGHHGRLWMALGLYALAVYSKESAVSFPIVALAYFWILLRRPFVRSMKLSGGFFAVAIVFVIHRHLVIGQTSQTAPLSGSYWQSLVDTVPSALSYVRLGFGIPPFTIVYAHLERGRALLSLQVVAGAIVLLAGVATTIIALKSERWRLLGFGFLWAAAFFLPVSNIIPMMQYMAERFMYLPLIGLLLAVAFLLLQLPRSRLVLIGACTAIAFWAVVAWDRSWSWSDDLTLFVETAMSNPRNQVVENNAADAILNLEPVKRVTRAGSGSPPSATDVQGALRALSKARMAFPQNGPLANSMGVSWIHTGDLEKAIECFRDAAAAAPRSAIYCRNLGMALVRAGRHSDAERMLKQLLPFHENDIPILRMLCDALISQKRMSEAVPLINRLKKLDPNSPEYDQWLVKAAEKPDEKPEPGNQR